MTSGPPDFPPPSNVQPPFPPPAGNPLAPRPPSFTVFGVMHIVFAALGLFWSLISVVQYYMMRSVMEQAMKDPELHNVGFDAQMKMQERLVGGIWLKTGCTVVVAIVMLIAGVKLVRSMKDSIKWSNLYAWVSIGAKLVTIGYLAVQAQEKMPEIPGASPEMSSMMGGMMSAMAIGVAALGMIYPGLTLFLMNRPHLKEWLAQFGK